MTYSQSNTAEDDIIPVVKCNDFTVTGIGENAQWSHAPWVSMQALRDHKVPLATRFKVMYSATGLYVMAECEDREITTSYTTDQDDIWKGDVFEVFLQTDPGNPLYFEYEINPLNAELAILVPNNNGDFFGWSPWHYEGNRKIQKAVKIQGGDASPGAKIKSWTAEIFIPYALFKALKNVPPVQGTIWKGNFCRIDHDGGTSQFWAWRPINKSFHEYQNYGSLLFE